MSRLNRISKPKLVIIIVIAVVVVGAAAAAVIFFFNKPESYRMIKVVALEGTATVQRGGVGDIDAYVGMNLQSGDRMRLDETSTTTIMLDDDKYILLEPGTVLTVEAYGSKENNQTTINLECGAILNTITSNLSENSSYVVNVPNAVMAVRGTCYRVSVIQTGDNKYEIGLEVFSGKVESQLLDDDGKPIGEGIFHDKNTSTVIVSDGKETDGNGKAYYLVLDDEIDYESLPKETVDMIMDIYYSGHAPLQDAVSMLIRHNNKDAVEYVKSHEYKPTGTLTGTAPDLGELTASGGDASAPDGGNAPDAPQDEPNEPAEPVGGDGTGVVNEPTEEPNNPDNPDNSDNPDNTDGMNESGTPDVSDNPSNSEVSNNPADSGTPDSSSSPDNSGSPTPSESQSNSPAVTGTTPTDNPFGSLDPYNPYNPNNTSNPQQPSTPAPTPSYTAVFLDPDGVVIN